MAAQLRVGALGLSHDHIWPHLRALAAGELGQLVAAADPNPALRARLIMEQGEVPCYAEYDALLERTDLDALFVYADNRAAADLAAQALSLDLPVMLEKPLAADLAGAERLLAAANAASVPLMVNWPTVWRPAIRHGLDLVRAGLIGEIVQLSQRGGHRGPREFGCSPQFCDWLYDPHRNGGGALVDYCGYGALLARVLLGHPTSVTAVSAHLRKDGLTAEDNAIVVLRYPRALGLLEASWTQVGDAPGRALVVYGDAGTLLVHQPRAPSEGQPAAPGLVQLVRHESGSQSIEPPPLPPDEQDGPTYFLSRLRAGAPIGGLCAPDLGRDVQEVLEAALISSAEGREVTLPLGHRVRAQAV
jgi:predicted dehydrogenase